MLHIYIDRLILTQPKQKFAVLIPVIREYFPPNARSKIFELYELFNYLINYLVLFLLYLVCVINFLYFILSGSFLCYYMYLFAIY